MTKIKYYSLDEVDKYKAQYYMIFGERSNGKSFAVKKRLLINYFEKNQEFVICKRYDEDMKSKVCSTMFADMEEWILDKYGYRVKFYHGKWLVYADGLEGKISDCQTIGYALSISKSDRAKGSQFPKVTTILLEEFMSMNATYIPDEINLFINLTSTIFRNRLNGKVYMLGNAISKHSPYADALGIKLHRMKKGEIIKKQFENSKGFKTTFVVQRTENVDVFDNENNENKIVYNVFGNSGYGSMITTGDFETGIYNLTINNITLDENIKKLPKDKKYKLVNKTHHIPFFVHYEGYFYKTYIVPGENPTLAFREIKGEFVAQHGYILNNKEKINGCINIKNIVKFNTDDNYLDLLLDTIIHCIHQDNVIFASNECGEDVYNAFRLSGLNI